MKKCAFRTSAALALVTALFLVAAHADDRPVKQNKDFVPAAQAGAFPMVTTGVIVKIKSVAIGQNGNSGRPLHHYRFPGNVAWMSTACRRRARKASVSSSAYIPQGPNPVRGLHPTTTDQIDYQQQCAAKIQAGLDTGGSFALVDAMSGTWDYTFGTKLPASYDATVTHTVGMQASRNFRRHSAIRPCVHGKRHLQLSCRTARRSQ